MVKVLRIPRPSGTLLCGVLLMGGAAAADPPGSAAAGAAGSAADTHGGFFSSLKQAFSQNLDREVVWAHFDVGTPPDTHRFYCLIDPKTGKREPNGVAGEPFLRRDGMTGLKAPAISPVSCADAEHKGILSTSPYTVKGSAATAAIAPTAVPATAAVPAAAPVVAAPPPPASAPSLAPAVAVAPAAAAHAPGSDLRAQMEAVNATFLSAYNTPNVTAFKDLYTRDAMLLAPGTPPLVGAESIGAFWADRVKGGSRKNHRFEIVSVWEEGRYAYQVARYTVDVLDEKGEIFKSAGNTVRIFERQPDGRWLTKVHIFNSY